MSATSMALMPASRAAWTMRAQSASVVAPHAPNIIVPRHSGVTDRPDAPRARVGVAISDVGHEGQVLVHRPDGGRALTDGRRHPLHRSRPQIADGEEAGPARLVRQRAPVEGGPLLAEGVRVERAV